jgi:E3 ubiquitin-protein ligase UBR7
MVIRESPEEKWKIMDGDSIVSHENELENAEDAGETQLGEKRPLDAETNETSELEARAKRQRVDIDSDTRASTSSSVCLAPPVQAKAQDIMDQTSKEELDYSLGAGDIFLTDGWRKRWCGCEEVSQCHPCRRVNANLRTVHEAPAPTQILF